MCPQDPRTKDQLRSEAIGALSYGQDRLACLCQRPDCEAFLRPPSTGVVIHLIAHPDTITGDGPSGLPPVVPPVDGARGADDGGAPAGPFADVEPELEDATDDVPDADVEPEDAAVDVDTDDAFAEPNWAMETEPTSADHRADAPADPDADGDATVDAETDSASTESDSTVEDQSTLADRPTAESTDQGDVGSGAEFTATEGVTDTDDVATDATGDCDVADTTVDDTTDDIDGDAGIHDLDGDAATDGGDEANDAAADTDNADAAPEPTTPDPTTVAELAPRTPIPFITPEQECAGLDGVAPPLYDKPLTQLTWAELFHPRPSPQHLSSLPPATLLDGAHLSGTVLPGAIARRAATGARISIIVHPGQAPPEPHYRPSPTLADFIRCRDQTCRYPGCTKPASTTDIDHTIPYPYGPTAASNLKCLCREHHLLKTFWNGWHDRQLPDGTVIWTTPDGRTHTTRPGSHTDFPQLCAPTAPITAHPPPPRHAHGLKMPTRRATRTQDRRHRALTERQANRRALEEETALTGQSPTWTTELERPRLESHPPPF
ncbi:HNH endonuclease signature motif containing protein [Mycolicibacterium madagascariense]|uniref:HNH endonuclease signature motif containing protein n=1 Tax=Mycolicibacterium madagascariense TaxID=212765 RepID=UPI0021F2A54C|nr:HNH endonuclease signature motif containing protein [Mycolicibacterium madagascariense]